MRSRVTLRFIILAAAALLAGCGDDDNPVKPPPPPAYRTASSPENVLVNMVTAYASRDSVEYRKTLDFEYMGTSTDMNLGTTLTFFNVDEVQHIQAFATATSIVDVSFSLGSESSWDRLASDLPAYPDWAVIQISGSQFYLRVDDVIAGTLTVQSPNEAHTFRFKPTTPASTSPTDTLWTLVRWEELLTP